MQKKSFCLSLALLQHRDVSVQGEFLRLSLSAFVCPEVFISVAFQLSSLLVCVQRECRSSPDRYSRTFRHLRGEKDLIVCGLPQRQLVQFSTDWKEHPRAGATSEVHDMTVRKQESVVKQGSREYGSFAPSTVNPILARWRPIFSMDDIISDWGCLG